jgi:hypothetical protein
MGNKISIPSDVKIQKVMIVPSIRCEKYSAGSLKIVYDGTEYTKDTEETYSGLTALGDTNIGKSWSLQKYATGTTKNDDVIDDLGNLETSTVLSPVVVDYSGSGGITMDEFKTKINNAYIQLYNNGEYDVNNAPIKTKLIINSVIINLVFNSDVSDLYVDNWRYVKNYRTIKVIPLDNQLMFVVTCSALEYFLPLGEVSPCSIRKSSSSDYYIGEQQGGGSCPGPSRGAIMTSCRGGRDGCVDFYNQDRWSYSFQMSGSGTGATPINLAREYRATTNYNTAIFIGRTLKEYLDEYLNVINPDNILKANVKVAKNTKGASTGVEDKLVKCTVAPNLGTFTMDDPQGNLGGHIAFEGWNFDGNKCNYPVTSKFMFDGTESKACGDNSDLLLQRGWLGNEIPPYGDSHGTIECVYNIRTADDLKILESVPTINSQKDESHESLLLQLQKQFCDRSGNDNIAYNTDGDLCSSLDTSGTPSGTPSGGGDVNEDCLTSDGSPIPYASLTTDALKSECFPAGEPDSSCVDSSIKSKECHPGCYSGDDEISYDELATTALKDVCYPAGDPGADEGQICTPEDEIKNALLYAYDENGNCVVNKCRTGYTKNKDGTKCKKETDKILYAIIGIILLFVLLLPVMV